MNESIKWLDEAYSHTLEDERRGLERRHAHNPSLKIEEVQGILHNLYINEGNNWEGRGPLADAVLAATIAAYEEYIAEWKKELPQ